MKEGGLCKHRVRVHWYELSLKNKVKVQKRTLGMLIILILLNNPD